MDKELLFKSRLKEEDVELPGVGTVRIRALNRAEVLRVQDKPMEASKMERLLLSLALVEPKLTEAEVGQWQEASDAGEIESVTQAIMKLSGLEDAAAKAAYQQFRG